jgi:hypothetical protein
MWTDFDRMEKSATVNFGFEFEYFFLALAVMQIAAEYPLWIHIL